MSIQQSSNILNNSLTIKEIQENYNLDTTIQEIASITNEKIALFIGRTAREALPQEEGTVWISGDLSFDNDLFSPDRLHLWMDFNNADNCEKLKGRIDLVVIDQSTVKFLNQNFINNFTSFLKPLPTSKFIFESCPYLNTFSPDTEEPKNNFSHLILPFSILDKEVKFTKNIFDNYLEKQGGIDSVRKNNHPYFQKFIEDLEKRGKSIDNVKNWKSRFYTFFSQNSLGNEDKKVSPMNQASLDAQEDTFEYLKTLFEDVVFFKNTDYPYPTNYGNKKFYIATGPRLENS